MRKDKKIDTTYWDESTHTLLSYWLLVISVGIEYSLGIQYINEYFGQMCLIEAFFGLCGILLLDLFHGKRLRIYPKPFKKIHKYTFARFGIAFIVIALIQILFQVVPLVTSTEMALGIVFVAPIEEYFFRGILMEFSFSAGKNSKNKLTLWTYNPIKKKPDKQISYVEIAGIIISASIFAAFHVNYYSQTNLMWMVFVGGIWLSFIYFWNRDLTAIILAHFLLNIVFVVQYYQIYGLV